MKTNKAGIDLIKSFEGCRLKAYKCPAGIWTIGYGHTAGVSEGMQITQEQADAYLKADLEKYEGYVDKYVDNTLNENQFSALVSFAYNCGAGNLQMLVRNRTNEQIAEAITRYNKAGGKKLNGLVRRRAAEQQLFLKGSNSASADNTEYLKCSYTGCSIVAALNSINVKSTYAYRKQLALANGIKNYSGTAGQNTTLLILLKQGKLKKA